MAEFLDTFDVERERLLEAVEHFQSVWERFQERQTIQVEGRDLSDSLLASELALVRKELQAAEFAIGLFGLIKRGKSTLMNALVGREVSSMHVTPETAVPVYVGYAEEPGAVVHFADGRDKHVMVEDVHEYTSQKHNSNNKLGVTHVEQWVPVGFLRNGTRLIDTPGLDDAEADEVYTERTLQELDVVNAGVVVFLSPPTVSGTEMKFLTEVVSRDLSKTFLVCNMYPQHFHDKQTRLDVLNYVGGRIVEASRRAGKRGEVRVYPVCALEAWEARLEDDIDKWKASGADRLLRDIETYLADVAGKDALLAASERIVKAAEMAKGEVKVRQQLLEDPQQLSRIRSNVDGSIRELEQQFDNAVRMALADVDPLKLRVRGIVLRPFSNAKRAVEDAGSIDELESFSGRFRREVEVAGEQASRAFAAGFEGIVERVRSILQERFNAVMTDLRPGVGHIQLSARSLLVTPDQLQNFEQQQARSQKTAALSGVAGGVLGGGVAMAAAGALLGPIGLIGGALVGWKLSGLVGGGSVARAKEAVEERLDEISAELLRDFDQQVMEAVDALKGAVDRRRRAFASDLYQQFDLVESFANDPDVVDSYRRDTERFVVAFEACANRARNAVGETVA